MNPPIDNTPTPGPSNAPAPPRRFGLLAWLLMRWLGIVDQRNDFNALAMTLTVKDQLVDGQRRDLEATARTMQRLAQQLHHVTSLAGSAQDRLHWYETRVPQIAGAKKAYDQALAREQKRRETLIATHPEWTEAVKHHVRQTGEVPGEPSANGNGANVPNSASGIEVVQRMPQSAEDLENPDRLRIVREGEGFDDTQADGS